MKKLLHFFSTLIAVSCLFACTALSESGINITTTSEQKGTIVGKALCTNSDDASKIIVTLVPTEGVISADLYQSQISRSSESFPLSRALSSAQIVSAHADKNGNYTFNDVEPGILQSMPRCRTR